MAFTRVEVFATELGDERRCDGCGDLWPLDSEFFFRMPKGFRGLSPYCKACHMERYRGKPRGRAA